MVIRLVPADGRNSLPLPVVANAWAGLVQALETLHDLKLTFGNDLDRGWPAILCPCCNMEVDPYWFAELFDTQCRFSHQQSQVVTMPCCASNFSLYGLAKLEKQAVSGVVISFRARERTADTHLIRRLEAFFGQPLRVYYDLERVEEGTVCYA